jgi:hypothetical protein
MTNKEKRTVKQAVIDIFDSSQSAAFTASNHDSFQNNVLISESFDVQENALSISRIARE